MADKELWREHAPRYRAFLVGISVLLTVYTAFAVEEISYWGGKSRFCRAAAVPLRRWSSSPSTEQAGAHLRPDTVLQDRSVERMLRGHAVSNVVPILGGIIVALVQGALALRASVLCGSHRRRIAFLSVVGGLVAISLLAGAAVVAANSLLVSLLALLELQPLGRALETDTLSVVSNGSRSRNALQLQ